MAFLKGFERPMDIKRKVVTSLKWVGSVNLLSQLLSWGMTIVVIRKLAPVDYGLMSMAMVLIGFFTMIGDFGLYGAIVQRKEVTRRQLEQVLGFILLVNLGFFSLVYAGAPFAADFYADRRLIEILRVLSCVFLLVPLYIIPHSLLLKEMNFKKTSMIDLLGNITAGSTSLFLAFQGFGVWALVYGTMVMFLVRTAGFLLVGTSIFKPSFRFREIKEMLSFSSFFTGTMILRYFFFKTDVVVGGKFLGAGALGLYAVANQLAFTPLEKISSIIPQVAFPAFSKIQDDMGTFSSHFLKALRLLNFITIPSFAGVAILAPYIVHFLLGPKWEQVILPAQILCMVMPLRALDILFIPAMNGLGRSGIGMVNSLVSFVIMTVSFILGIQWGYVGLCWAWVIGYPFVYMFMAVLCIHFFKIDFLSFIKTYIGPAVSVSVMVGIAYNLRIRIVSLVDPFMQAIILSTTSLISFFCVLYVLDRSILIEIKNMIMNARS